MEKDQVTSLDRSSRQIIARYLQADGLDLMADLNKSHGSQIYDRQSGEFYLDLFSCFATMPLGFNHPRMASPEVREELGWAAVQKPSNSDLYTPPMADFVDTFARVGNRGLFSHMFFIEGGALAVENALKTAFDWKVRKNLAAGKGEKGSQVIYFREAFHGRTGYTLSLTNTFDPRKTQYFPKFDWPCVANPKCLFPLEGENLQATVEAEATAIREIEEAIRERADDIACLIIEPIQSEGGDNHFRREFHLKLREICDQEDILLIHDEVQTGWGGTGRFWACEHYVIPDVVAFGKKSQVCGILVGDRVDQVEQNVFKVSSRINSTWGGNLTDMVRARIYLEIFEQENLLQRVGKLGAWLKEELHGIESDFPSLISNVRGLGLMCAMDFPDTEKRGRFTKELFKRKVVMLGCGSHSVRFRTSLTISREDLEKGLAAIREVLSGMR